MSSVAEESVERWLKCQVDKGMFSDELAVTYPSDGQSKKSVFVPAQHVQGTPGAKGKVRVFVVSRDGKLMAVLPSSRKDIVVVTEGDFTE